MEQGVVDLRAIGILVLDEADRMLDMGFIQPIKRIIAQLPRNRRTFMFSATMPAPIRELAERLLRDPARVAVNPVSQPARTVSQRVYHVAQEEKTQLLKSLLTSEGMTRALVFTRTKHGANRLSRRLEKAGLTAGVISADKAQNARVRALDSFRDGSVPLLIATDVAARAASTSTASHTSSSTSICPTAGELRPSHRPHRPGRSYWLRYRVL